nr:MULTISPECIES: polymer-forming cytoskeletal protein [Halorubrum]
MSCSPEVTDDVALRIRASTAGDQGSVELTRSATVTCEGGGVCSGPRDVFDANLDGDIDSENTVVISSGVKVSGDVAGDCVMLEDEAEIDGDVGAGGNVSIGEKAQVDGDVDAGGSVTLTDGAKVKGNISEGG